VDHDRAVWARLPIQPGPRPGQVSEQKIQIGALTRVKPVAVTAAPNGADPRALGSGFLASWICAAASG